MANGDDRLLRPTRAAPRKVVVSIIPNEDAEPSEMRDWQIVHGDVRKKPEIVAEMITFMESHGARSTLMASGLMGCPHQEGIDYARFTAQAYP